MSSSTKRSRVYGANRKRRGNYGHFILPINDISYPLSLYKNKVKGAEKIEKITNKGVTDVSVPDVSVSVESNNNSSLEKASEKEKEKYDTTETITSRSITSQAESNNSNSIPSSSNSALLSALSSLHSTSSTINGNSLLPRTKESFYIDLVNKIDLEHQITEKQFENENTKTSLDFLDGELGLGLTGIKEVPIDEKRKLKKRKFEYTDATGNQTSTNKPGDCADGGMATLESPVEQEKDQVNQKEEGTKRNPKKPKLRKIVDMIQDNMEEEETEKGHEKKSETQQQNIQTETTSEKTSLENIQEKVNTVYSDMLLTNDNEDIICDVGEFDFIETPEQDQHELQKLENELKMQKKKYSLLDILLNKLEFLQGKVRDYM